MRLIPRTKLGWLIFLVVLGGLAVGAYFLASRSFLTRDVVLSRLGVLLGGTLEARSVQIDPSGKLVIEDAYLRAPGVPGDAAILFSVKRLTAWVEPRSILSGSPKVQRVELESPVARISQSVDDGSVNVAALRMRSMGAGRLLVPMLIVRDGVVELGEHITDPLKLAGLSGNDTGYKVLKQFGVEGEVQRASGEQGDMLITFRQTPPGGDDFVGPMPLTLSGVVNDSELTVELGAVPLSGWSMDSMPGPLRAVLQGLRLEGDITGAALTYRFEGGLAARMGFSGVAVSLPVEPQPGETLEGESIPVPREQRGQRLRLTSVNGYVSLAEDGRVSGQMIGLAEAIPYEVTLEVAKADPDAAFTVTISARDVELTRNPDILKFAPGVARLRLAQFNNPTGIVDTTVVVSRGEPVEGRAAAVRVRGDLWFRDGTAAFERFPYRFSGMRGHISFSEEEIVIHEITGSASGGVQALATGRIAPPTSEAAVEINVKMTGLPLDDTLTRALLHRARIMDELLNKPEYERLVREGIIDPKEFTLGGYGDATAKVTRRPGPGNENWTDTIIIDVKEARMLPRRFPYPVLARDMHIEKVDDEATLSGGDYRGLRGGRARIAAKLDLAKLEAAGGEFVPDVEIEATEIPLDRMLSAAMPRPESLGGSDILRRRMEALNLSGHANVKARIWQSEKNEPAYKIEIDPALAKASPAGPDGTQRVAFEGIEGAIEVTAESVAAQLRATAKRLDNGAASPLAADVNLKTPAGIATSGFEITTSSARFDLSIAAEDVVGVFAPEAGKKLEAWRQAYSPRGVVDASVTAQRGVGAEDVKTSVLLRGARQAGWTDAGTAVTFDQSAGTARIENDASGTTLTFEKFVAQASADGSPAEIAVEGALSSAAGPLRETVLKVRAGRFESPLTGLALKVADAPKLREFMEQRKISGAFDLDLTLSPRDDNGRAAIRGELTPRDFSLLLEGQPLALRVEAGEIEFNEQQARATGLRLVARDWTISGDATALRTDDGGLATHSDLSLEAASLSPDLAAILPAEAREAIDALSFKIDGPFKLSRTPVSVTFLPNGDVGAFKMAMHATMEGASLDVGAKVDRAAGALDLTVERQGDGSPTVFELWSTMDRFRFAGVQMTGGRVRAGGESRGRVLIPHFSADCYRGRAAGSAVLDAATQTGSRPYSVELLLAGVRFGPLLSDLKAGRAAGADKSPAQEEPVDPDRGIIDASLTFSGMTGNPDSRRGRGSATIGDGRVLSLPLVVPIIRASNLQLPIDEKMDFAAADFYLQGNTIAFDQMTISSPGVEIYGYGTCEWPSTVLDLRFRPKARTRIPLVSVVMEGIRNELLSASASGTLDDPRIDVRTLSGTRRVLGTMFGREPTSQEQRLDAIERSSKEDPRFARPGVRDGVGQSGGTP